jgi:hypothetical protein
MDPNRYALRHPKHRPQVDQAAAELLPPHFQRNHFTNLSRAACRLSGLGLHSPIVSYLGLSTVTPRQPTGVEWETAR